jgi:hypothetical protein
MGNQITIKGNAQHFPVLREFFENFLNQPLYGGHYY